MAMGSAIFEKIDLHLQHHRMGTWTGTFRDYLGMVIKQPYWHSGRTPSCTT